MNISKKNLALTIVGAYCDIILISGNFELPLPATQVGKQTTKGILRECSIKHLGFSSSSRYGVNIYLASDSRRFSTEFSKSQLAAYQKLCESFGSVEIEFHAKRLLMRPKNFYVIDRIEEIEQSEKLGTD